jgi:hypothetical protein
MFETGQSKVTAKSLWQYLSGLDRNTVSSSNTGVAFENPNDHPVGTNTGVDDNQFEIENQITEDPQEIQETYDTTIEDHDDAYDERSTVSNSEGELNAQEGVNNEIQSETVSRQTGTTISGRAVRMPVRYNDYVALSVNPVEQKSYNETQSYAYEATMSTEQDTMYLHQALKAHDRDEFLKAMKDEIDAHVKNKIGS